MSLKGLVIRQPWIGMILRGEKSWEMRPDPWRFRGQVALIQQGSGTVVGLAEMVDDLPPLSEEDLRSTFEKHRIPSDQIGEAISKRWVRPWVLANVSTLQQPVRYKHTSGGSRVNLSVEEEAAVLGTSRTASHLTAAAHCAGSVTEEHTAMAQRVLGELSEGPARLKMPAEASASVTRRGNKLYIDIEGDDGLQFERRKSSGWAEAIGTFAALATMICMFGFMIHLTLGMMSSSISALSSFKWLIALFVSGLIAAVLGQGHLLEDAFEKR